MLYHRPPHALRRMLTLVLRPDHWIPATPRCLTSSTCGKHNGVLFDRDMPNWLRACLQFHCALHVVMHESDILPNGVSYYKSVGLHEFIKSAAHASSSGRACVTLIDKIIEGGLVVDSEMGICVFIPPLAHWVPLSSHESQRTPSKPAIRPSIIPLRWHRISSSWKSIWAESRAYPAASASLYSASSSDIRATRSSSPRRLA